MIRFSLLRLAALCFCWISGAAFAAEENARPNVIVILVDDMGWTDLGCYGSRYYETPHIDKLAAQGMKFTAAYSACTVCSPTRASLLTGQYPARLRITDWIAGHARPFAKLKVPDWTMWLDPALPNLGRVLRDAGYATASVGKWHLGPEECWPERQGFDRNFGGYDRGQPPSYFAPYKIPTLTDGPDGEFLTDRLTDEALKFITENRDRPFFLYLPHYAVHTPLMAKRDVITKYKKKTQASPGDAQRNAMYAGLVESVDDSTGRITALLDGLDLSRKTLVIFTSDNGGLLGPTANGPLRAGKGSAYEGGVRVPLIARMPGRIRAGSESAAPVITPDLYPTVLALAGARPPAAHVVDGENLWPLFEETGALKRDAVFWHYPHYHPGGATPYSAIREGDLRLVEFHEDQRVEMYDVKNDIGETKDLAPERPEIAAALRARLRAWLKATNAQMPGPNPAHNPAKDQPGAARK